MEIKFERFSSIILFKKFDLILMKRKKSKVEALTKKMFK